MAAAAALTLSGTASADIYSYTDGEGVMHFTNVHQQDARFKVYLKGNGDGKRGAGNAVAASDHDPARYNRYDEWIHQAATLYQIPEPLVRAVIKVESDFDPRAVSFAGARGLMQLMPGTADRLQVRDIDDPRENIFGGVRYLRILANDFNGDLQLTVAGYNAGEEAVMKYGGIPPYAETRDYVVRVTDFYHRFRSTGDPTAAPPAPEAAQ
jgi:soluble lytic murein transglycosylase-like protein